ncbi:MAG: YitT family protein [Clostridiales bacterium]|nr:YitT family protein [Clostridiales bacterium]
MKFDWKEDGKRIFVICLAALISAVNVRTFVRTGGLYPGGVTGMTLLIQRAGAQFFQTSISYTLVNFLLNAVPFYIGIRYVGTKFTLYSALFIGVNSVLIDILPSCVITYDTLLICIFGGIINGMVVGLCLMMNATTGGTDFVGIYLSEKKGVDTWNIVLGFNMIILGAAGLMFGWDKALYSIIFQFASTQVIQVVYKRHQQKTLFVVTDSPEQIYEIISGLTHHGATLIEGEGTFGHKSHKIVYSVVSSEEIKPVVRAIREIDPKAFVNVVRTEQISGRFYKRPNE